MVHVQICFSHDMDVVIFVLAIGEQIERVDDGAICGILKRHDALGDVRGLDRLKNV